MEFLKMMGLCLLIPAIVTAGRPMAKPFTLEGRVYCDTCRAGFETSAITYIPGAKVRVECQNRNTHKLVYRKEETTDATGTYKMKVHEDHEDQICDVLLVSSPQTNCANIDSGRDRARVILSQSNGIASNKRFANAMGFMMDEPLAICSKVLEQYKEDED